jgi:homoserine O-succinyltransferase
LPVVVDASRSAPRLPWVRGIADGDGAAGRLEIGLLNNMPDAALQATERQFIDLLAAAAESRLVRLHLFSLPEIARSDAAGARLRAAYSPLEELGRHRLDALIVTGCEPKADSLADEPYWKSLTQVVDWAEHNTISTVWSCLAAHAAVLHLDGIGRHRLAHKSFGVFDCAPVADDPILAGITAPIRVAHSRLYDLREAELAAHGYRVLTRSPEVGVDLFVKRWRSLFVFLQGHPEYDATTLGREYRRDVGRFLKRERPTYPRVPQSYFDPQSEQALEAFAAQARTKRDPALLAQLPDLRIRSSLAAAWGAGAVPIVRNWLTYLAVQRS